MSPPVGGLFGFKFSSRPHPWKFGVLREVLARKWGGLFWATSLEKIIGGVIEIISFRPGGWMQQSSVPRCAILSVGSTGGTRQLNGASSLRCSAARPISELLAERWKVSPKDRRAIRPLDPRGRQF